MEYDVSTIMIIQQKNELTGTLCFKSPSQQLPIFIETVERVFPQLSSSGPQQSWINLMFSTAAQNGWQQPYEWLCSKSEYLEMFENKEDRADVIRNASNLYLSDFNNAGHKERALAIIEHTMMHVEVDGFVGKDKDADPGNKKELYATLGLKKFNKGLFDFFVNQGSPSLYMNPGNPGERVSAIENLNHVWQLEKVLDAYPEVWKDSGLLSDLKKFMYNVSYEAFFGLPVDPKIKTIDHAEKIVSHTDSFHQSLSLIEQKMAENNLDFKSWVVEAAFAPTANHHKNMGMDMLQEWVMNTYKDLTPYSLVFKNSNEEMTLKEAIQKNMKAIPTDYIKRLDKEWSLQESLVAANKKIDPNQVHFRF